MSDYQKFHFSHIRLAILRLLDDQPGYTANDSVIYQAVNMLGLGCTRDQIRHQITWLSEQGLLKVEDVSVLKVAALTERGGDVANGRAIVDGVQRPSPRNA